LRQPSELGATGALTSEVLKVIIAKSLGL